MRLICALHVLFAYAADIGGIPGICIPRVSEPTLFERSQNYIRRIVEQFRGKGSEDDAIPVPDDNLFEKLPNEILVQIMANLEPFGYTKISSVDGALDKTNHIYAAYTLVRAASTSENLRDRLNMFPILPDNLNFLRNNPRETLDHLELIFKTFFAPYTVDDFYRQEIFENDGYFTRTRPRGLDDDVWRAIEYKLDMMDRMAERTFDALFKHERFYLGGFPAGYGTRERQKNLRALIYEIDHHIWPHFEGAYPTWASNMDRNPRFLNDPLEFYSGKEPHEIVRVRFTNAVKREHRNDVQNAIDFLKLNRRWNHWVRPDKGRYGIFQGYANVRTFAELHEHYDMGLGPHGPNQKYFQTNRKAARLGREPTVGFHDLFDRDYFNFYIS